MATLYTNAHLIDPVMGINGAGEILVENGTVSAIATQIECSDRSVEKVDLGGLFLTPGLIDIHTHVFDSVGDFCLKADTVGINFGVTTVADAGTSGLLTFSAFQETVIKSAKTRVYTLLDKWSNCCFAQDR